MGWTSEYLSQASNFPMMWGPGAHLRASSPTPPPPQLMDIAILEVLHSFPATTILLFYIKLKTFFPLSFCTILVGAAPNGLCGITAVENIINFLGVICLAGKCSYKLIRIIRIIINGTYKA